MQCISQCIEVRPIKRRVPSTDAVLISLSADTRACYSDLSGVCSVQCVPSTVLQADARHCRALSKTALCSQPHNRMRSTRLESLVVRKDSAVSLRHFCRRQHPHTSYQCIHQHAFCLQLGVWPSKIDRDKYPADLHRRKLMFHASTHGNTYFIAKLLEGKMRCVDRNVIACTERMSAELIMLLHVDHRTLTHFTKMKSLNVER